MTLFRNKYRIESARMQGYDYSSAGYYFITICTKGRVPYFENIADGEMKLSPIGETAESLWREIPAYFPNAVLDTFVIMPDHIHGIILIADPDPRDDNGSVPRTVSRRDAINRVSTNANTNTNTDTHIVSPQSVSKMIRWYKGRCTHDIRRIHGHFAWQSRFYDRIIRDENELYRIREYIIHNPMKLIGEIT